MPTLRTMPMPASTRITQHDIADKLGIGQKTVSRAFTNPELVSDELRTRVLQTARELGYRPNTGARAMRTGRFESVVLVQSTERMASPMPEALLVGIDEVLAAVDVSLVLARLPDDQLVSDVFVPKVARELLADGLIINYDTNLPHRLIELIADHQLPAVWINSRQGETSVRPDDLQAGEDATQCLINHGHTRILYVDFFLEHHSWIHYSRKDRLAGYRTAMARAGLKQLEALPDFPVDPSAYAKQTIERFKPTAVIGYGEYETSACMLAALRAGLDIPRDLSLVTFSALPQFIGMEIATWIVPQLDIGRTVAQQVLAAMRDRGVVQKSVVLPFTSHLGASIAAPYNLKPPQG